MSTRAGARVFLNKAAVFKVGLHSMRHEGSTTSRYKIVTGNRRRRQLFLVFVLYAAGLKHNFNMARVSRCGAALCSRISCQTRQHKLFHVGIGAAVVPTSKTVGLYLAQQKPILLQPTNDIYAIFTAEQKNASTTRR